jgi:hypothetical protein
MKDNNHRRQKSQAELVVSEQSTLNQLQLTGLS